MNRLGGHFWTILPRLLADSNVPRLPNTEWLRSEVNDPDLGRLPVTGLYDPVNDREILLVILHGLGGSAESPYVSRAWHLARRMGFGILRLNLRGADRSGTDFYHAGLTADLEAILADTRLAEWRHIALLGFSLGGHVALKYLISPSDRRVSASAAICPPLDLEACQLHLDRRPSFVYRRHVLRGLREMYEAQARTGRVPTDPIRMRRVRALREWDTLTVVPRFRFRDVSHYYRVMSVGPSLQSVAVPSLIISSRFDPMIPFTSVSPFISALPSHIHVEILDRGGHVGFPAGRSIEEATLHWLREQSLCGNALFRSPHPGVSKSPL